jgi:hypothetical protein
VTGGGPRLASALSGRSESLGEGPDPIRVHACRPPAPSGGAARRLLIAALLTRFLQRRGEGARLEISPAGELERAPGPAADGLLALADRLGAAPAPGAEVAPADCLARVARLAPAGRLVHVGAPLAPDASERALLTTSASAPPIWLAVAGVAGADALATEPESALVQAISVAVDVPLELTREGAAVAAAWCARVREAVALLEAPQAEGPEPLPDAALAGTLVAARTGLYTALDDGFRTDLALEEIVRLADAAAAAMRGERPPSEGQRQEVRRELAATLDVLGLGALARGARAPVAG